MAITKVAVELEEFSKFSNLEKLEKLETFCLGLVA